jgi:hypothetical protein
MVLQQLNEFIDRMSRMANCEKGVDRHNNILLHSSSASACSTPRDPLQDHAFRKSVCPKSSPFQSTGSCFSRASAYVKQSFGKPQYFTSPFADNYLLPAHNQSMNKNQRRGQLLSDMSPVRTRDPHPHPPPCGNHFSTLEFHVTRKISTVCIFALLANQ